MAAGMTIFAMTKSVGIIAVASGNSELGCNTSIKHRITKESPPGAGGLKVQSDVSVSFFRWLLWINLGEFL